MYLWYIQLYNEIGEKHENGTIILNVRLKCGD